MNYRRTLGLVLMMPAIITIGYIAYIALVEAPMLPVAIGVTIIFVYGLTLYVKK